MYYSQDNIADSLLKLKKKMHLLERQRQEMEEQERMKG